MEACSVISSYQRWETKSEAFVCDRRKDIAINTALIALSILGITSAYMGFHALSAYSPKGDYNIGSALIYSLLIALPCSIGCAAVAGLSIYGFAMTAHRLVKAVCCTKYNDQDAAKDLCQRAVHFERKEWLNRVDHLQKYGFISKENAKRIIELDLDIKHQKAKEKKGLSNPQTAKALENRWDALQKELIYDLPF